MIIREKSREKLSHGGQAAALLHAILMAESEIDREREHFWVIGLSTGKRVQYVELAHLGSLTSCVVHPREVFRHAVARGVDSIIVGHNHPGATYPRRSTTASLAKSSGMRVNSLELRCSTISSSTTGATTRRSMKGGEDGIPCHMADRHI